MLLSVHIHVHVIQAYTSQFVALVMFALVMSEDRVSMQPRRQQIIQGLKKLPGTYTYTIVPNTVEPL